ncbi:Bug family tripartite tricarboxylate transporter substrate binding protein [Noviherbaspirillum soli]|uniref:Bug family tripartite tricarboxylate transporter substrate binding protein n=1 Tax=Noviherbaspirillum soli TaxID=1064518 RepID=UPI00188A8DD5|nr:tripartite tricarboxylate transporter substrate binding protein [Noviherbaspirillum soli]
MLKQLHVAGLLAAILINANALAQNFPEKTVSIIVPQTPGGASDIIARTIGAKLSERWGKPVVVENKPGAGGNIGTDFVAKAPADGYTLLMSYVGTQAINGAIYNKLPYDPFTDFSPIATVATVPFVLLANNNLPAKSVQDLIAYAASNPGKVNFGSAGNGSLNHLLGEIVNTTKGVKMVHVPYKGAAAALTDTISGQIQVTFSSLPSAAGFIRSGNLRALGVTGTKRTAKFPSIPTLSEGGVSGLELSPWFGLLAPAHTPAAVVKKINADIADIVSQQDVVERLAAVGADAYTISPEAFANLLQSDIFKWKKVVKASGAHID